MLKMIAIDGRSKFWGGPPFQMSGKSESRTQWLYQSLPSKQQSRLKTGVASKEGMFGTILHLWPDLPGGIETHQRSTGELCLTRRRDG